MSDFRFTCPHCGTHLECDDSMNGQIALCPNCDNNIILKRDHPFINEQLLEEQKERERQEQERQEQERERQERERQERWGERQERWEREWLEWKREQKQREQELKQNLKTLEVEKELLVQLECLEPDECRWSLATRLFAIVDLIAGIVCVIAGADADNGLDKRILINTGIWLMIGSIPTFLASWLIQQTYVSNNLKKQQILLLNKIARKMKVE